MAHVFYLIMILTQNVTHYIFPFVIIISVIHAFWFHTCIEHRKYQYICTLSAITLFNNKFKIPLVHTLYAVYGNP